MLTKQQVFDRVVKHLNTQGHPALDSTGNCCYRTRKGDKCSIGCLIPAKRYTSKLENFPVWDDRVMEALQDVIPVTNTGLGYNSPYRELLQRLQTSHDLWEPGIKGARRMRHRLQKIAADNGLVFRCPAAEHFVWEKGGLREWTLIPPADSL